MKHMTWNPEAQAYFGETTDGQAIRVEGVEMAEAAEDAGMDIGELSGASVSTRWEDLSDEEQTLLDPDEWASCVGDNQNVAFV